MMHIQRDNNLINFSGDNRQKDECRENGQMVGALKNGCSSRTES
jgi:hypothetical protein